MSRLSDYRNRISRFNKELNAFVDLSNETQDGLGWAIKSNIAVKGLPLTAGCAAYKDSIAKDDATVVSNIRKSGGVILGTVNMHEAALGATTDNPCFGRTQNPWRIGFTPGGSSGGSASAVAAGLCDIALGTDTMGSVRIPSAYCGVQGHKPTFDTVSTRGVIPLSTTLDHVGPIARDVDTLWEALKIISTKKFYGTLEPLEFKGLKIGIWTGEGKTKVSDIVASGFQNVRRRIKENGADVMDFEPPEYQYSRSRRAGLLVSEIEASNVHGISLEKPTPEGFSSEFIEMILWGLRQSEDKKTAAYNHLEVVRQATDRVWSEVNFVISPTAPQQAFSFEESVPANQADFTAWANFANLPATSLYSGVGKNNLPLSVQVFAPTDCDTDALRLAKSIENLVGKPPLPPNYKFAI